MTMAKLSRELGSAPSRSPTETERQAGEDRPAARAAARALPLPQAQPDDRGPAEQPLPPGQGGGRPLLQPRPGGDLGRQRLRARAAGRRRAADPQPRRDAGARRPAARGHDAVHGPRRQPDRRQGLQHPLRRPRRAASIAPISMLGALIPVMAGVALAGRMQKKDLVALTYIGDGGTSTGDFHEGMNFAAVLDVPLRPDRRAQRLRLLDADLAADADQEHRRPAPRPTASRARWWTATTCWRSTRPRSGRSTRARGGGGPTLIEAKTFRMKGHAEHDDAGYVPKELFEEWKKKDPIDRFERHLLAERPGDGGGAAKRSWPRIDEELTARWTRRSPRRMPPPGARLRGACTAERAVMARTRSPTSKPSARRSGRRWSSDERVFLIGQDIGIYGGAFRVDRRHARPLRPGARHRHADQRVGHGRRGHRRGHDGHAAGRRDAVHRLHRLRLQPDRQLRRPQPLPLGPERADGGARPVRRRRARLGLPQPEPGGDLPARARA